MYKKHVAIILYLFTLIVLPSALFADTNSVDAIVVRSTTIKSSASFNAKVVKSVSLGYQVKVLSKKGGWVEVVGKQDNSRGWLRSYQVRNNSNRKTDTQIKENTSSHVIADLARGTSSLFGSKKPTKETQGVVATIGVRGLSEQELKRAKPNPNELKKMRSYASSGQAASLFARQGRLKAVK